MNNFLKIDNQENSVQNINKFFSNERIFLLKRIFLIFFILIIVLFSWTGTIDKASETFVDSSLKQAAIVYGTARAINATVSVLQTVSIPGLGLGVGQALDPLNSIVERFSTIMEISIGSLVIQKILIEITTNSLFNILLTISAITLVASITLKKYFFLKSFSKIFLTLVFLRFMIVISLAVNGIISNEFIKEKINSESNIIINASSEASSDVEKFNKSKKELEESKNQSDNTDKNSQESPPTQPIVTPPSLPQDISFKDTVKNIFSKPNKDSTQSPIVDGDNRSMVQKSRDWATRQTDKLKSVLDSFNPMKIANKIQNVVGNMINLMAIILLQTLILPILFIFLMKIILLKLWNNDIENFYTYANSTKNYIPVQK